MRTTLLVTAAIAGLVWTSGPALASPPTEPFEGNDAVWGCGPAAGVPPHHCINLKSQGTTGLIKVFEPDARWPQESVSTDPASDLRPCPHDPDADPDGTWWSPVPGLWVCHHRP